MYGVSLFSLLPLALAAPLASVTTTTTTTSSTPGSQLPFRQIVAFGDNLSDNGNGSYAHGVSDPSGANPKVYGYGTWTNGAVAVSYLADLLSTPLVADYAFGHAAGGSKWGATVDISFTPSPAGAPDTRTQIANYTGSLSSTKPAGANAGVLDNTLHFLWIGGNDVNLYHINVDSNNNTEGFAAPFAKLLAGQVKTLLAAGACHVFVPGIYAKELSPSRAFYADTPAKVANLGAAVSQANDAIGRELAAFGDAVLFYDVAAFMRGLWAQPPAQSGFTHEIDPTATGKVEFCDGYSQADWDECVTKGHGGEFFWMQYLDMTTRVHELIAQDMSRAIMAHQWK